MIFIALITFICVLFLAVIHIYWGLGGNWPAKSRTELLDIVVGSGESFPSAFACYVIALALVSAGIIALISVRFISLPMLEPYISWGLAVISFVLGMRGIIGYLPSFEKIATDRFNYYNKRFYNPLCIILSICYLILYLNKIH